MYSVAWKKELKKKSNYQMLNYAYYVPHTTYLTWEGGEGGAPMNTTVLWNLSKTTRCYVTQHDNP